MRPARGRRGGLRNRRIIALAAEKQGIERHASALCARWNDRFPGFPTEHFRHPSFRGEHDRKHRDAHPRDIVRALADRGGDTTVVNPAGEFGAHASHLATRFPHVSVVGTAIDPGWASRFHSRRANGRTIVKRMAIVCDVGACAMTCVIVATEGVPKRPVYALFTGLMALVPAFTALVLARRPSGCGHGVERIAALCNLALLGFVCWALVAQYPYPEGAGVVPLAIAALLAPVLSLVVLRNAGPPAGPQAKT